MKVFAAVQNPRSLVVSFFLMTLNFEQSTEVKLTGKGDNTTFELSGSGKHNSAVKRANYSAANAANHLTDPVTDQPMPLK